MENYGKESLDGSSIKPVSSLLSHFEQMAGPLRSSSTTRPASPKILYGVSEHEGKISESYMPFDHETQRSARPEERNVQGKRLSHIEHLSKRSPLPAYTSHALSLHVAPELNVLPPLSPPKARGFSLPISNGSHVVNTTYSHPSSNRPDTPHFGPALSPLLAASQPPSPPPARRSGEHKRDDTNKGPPPINRADKPRVGIKPISLTSGTDPARLAAQSPGLYEQRSPFSTPPKEDSPERETVDELSSHLQASGHTGIAPALHKAFAPPPLHYAVASKRMDHEIDGIGHIVQSPKSISTKPVLPMRTQIVQRDTVPAPPPRPSFDRTRSVASSLTSTEKMIPPKRILSNPVAQPPTPTRILERSLTVHRRPTSRDFKNEKGLSIAVESHYTLDTQLLKTPYEAANIVDYPDVSSSNRREPCLRLGAREIPAKHDTRIFDVCGEFACTSGLLTRVWSLLDGEIIMNLAHTEGIKIMSVAFKACTNVKGEGARLWLGNNIGDIIEVDVPSQSVVSSKSNAHTRREITKIYRYRDQMWTLDDGGTLHLWAPDSSGSPSLTNPCQSFRVPKGHTFSMIVSGELWLATGKDIRVFVPSLDGSTQFQVLQRPLCQANTGDVTSGTTIITQPDRVYFGHVDGKISIYSRHDYSCLGIVNVSLYKITSLAGVGRHLWAGFSTGMVYVYETRSTPWVVKKDWRAHSDPLINLIADRNSFWKLDRSLVVSLGQDNVLRIWDGLLQDDWLENEMQSQEANFCELESIKALVLTWNAGASTPYHLQHSDQDASFFRNLFRSEDSPDLLVFGFQELVDLEDKKTTAKSFFKSKKKDPSEQEHMSHQYRDWRDFLARALDEYMPRSELYHILNTATLVGLFTCVFVKSNLRDRIKNISEAQVKRGMGGLHGNKGALILRFLIDDTSMCFINCHLAAGQTQTKDRNTDISTILDSRLLTYERDPIVRQDSYVSGGDGTMILDHEIVILNGDLNYRIDTMGRDTVVNAVKANHLSKLLERDQLHAAKRRNPWFRLRALDEMPITFMPTYKYDVGSDNYDSSEKKRVPAWCDRILYRGRDRLRQTDYSRHEVRISDHRPVTGRFEIVIKRVEPGRRKMVWEESLKAFEKLKVQVGSEARLDYLMNSLGFDLETSKQIIAQGETRR